MSLQLVLGKLKNLRRMDAYTCADARLYLSPRVQQPCRAAIVQFFFIAATYSTLPVETPLQTEQEIRQRIWVELQRAVHDRHHEWRTPVLATVGTDGLPEARTVVLRQADASSANLVFYTDSRSPKVAELKATPHASLVFWSKRLSWQLRVQAQVSVQTSGPQVDTTWERLRQSPAAGDYLAAAAPGAVLPDAAAMPEHAGVHHHLGIVSAQVLAMDWLELARTGHRRAVLTATDFEWRVP